MAAGAVIAAGTAVDIYASRKAMKSQTKALEAQARERELAATEVMERFELRADMARLDTRGLVASQKAAFAKGGVDVTTGTPLLAEEEANRLTERAIEMEEREATFQSSQLMREADAERAAAKDAKKAFKIQAVAKIVQAGGNAYAAKKS
jgi:hypothetical protein